MKTNKNIFEIIISLIFRCFCAIAFFIIRLYHFYRENSSNPRNRWSIIGTIKNIYYFPVKCCPPVKLKDIYCIDFPSGIQLFNYIIVQAVTHEIIKCGEFRRLKKIQLEVSETRLCFIAPNQSDFLVTLNDCSKFRKGYAKIDNIIVATVDLGDEIAKWLNNVVKENSFKCRLMYCLPNPNSDVWNITKFMFFSKQTYRSHCHQHFGAEIEQFRPHILANITNQLLVNSYDWKYIEIGNAVFTKINNTYQDGQEIDIVDEIEIANERSDENSRRCKRQSKISCTGIVLRVLIPGVFRVGDIIMIK